MELHNIIEFIEKISYINAYLIIGATFMVLMVLLYFLTYLQSNSQHSSVCDLILYRKYKVIVKSKNDNDNNTKTHIVWSFGRLNAIEKVASRFYTENYNGLTFQAILFRSNGPVEISK